MRHDSPVLVLMLVRTMSEKETKRELRLLLLDPIWIQTYMLPHPYTCMLVCLPPCRDSTLLPCGGYAQFALMQRGADKKFDSISIRSSGSREKDDPTSFCSTLNLCTGKPARIYSRFSRLSSCSLSSPPRSLALFLFSSSYMVVSLVWLTRFYPRT